MSQLPNNVADLEGNDDQATQCMLPECAGSQDALCSNDPLRPRNPNNSELNKASSSDAPQQPGSERSMETAVKPNNTVHITGTPTAKGMLSPSRRTPLLPCASPPNSAAKHENEAALTLAWLAGGLVDNNDILLSSTLPKPTSLVFNNDKDTARPTSALPVTDTPFAVQLHARPATGTTTTSRARRAVTFAMDDEYDYNFDDGSVEDGEDLYFRNTIAGKRSRATINAARTARRAQREVGAAVAAASAGSKRPDRPKTHGVHSRVGRAMTSIVDFILKNQDEWLGNDASGVPERVVRLEFGNNPDTSKALRLLVSENKLVRNGLGGRKDPFSYVLADGFHPTPLEGPPPAPFGKRAGAKSAAAAAAKRSTSQIPRTGSCIGETSKNTDDSTPPEILAVGAEQQQQQPSNGGAGSAEAAAATMDSLTTSPPATTAITATAETQLVPSTAKQTNIMNTTSMHMVPAIGGSDQQQQQPRGTARRKLSLGTALPPITELKVTHIKQESVVDVDGGAAGGIKSSTRTRKPSMKAELTKELEQLITMEHTVKSTAVGVKRSAVDNNNIVAPATKRQATDTVSAMAGLPLGFIAAEKLSSAQQVSLAAQILAANTTTTTTVAAPTLSKPAAPQVPQLPAIESLQTPAAVQSIPTVVVHQQQGSLGTTGGPPLVAMPVPLSLAHPGFGLFMQQLQATQAYWMQQQQQLQQQVGNDAMAPPPSTQPMSGHQ